MSSPTPDTAAKAELSDAPMGEVTMDGDVLKVVFHRIYRFPVEKVWAALTIPERIADWFANAEIDLRPGGTLRLDGNGMRNAEMKITVCDPPRSLAWIWTIGPHETLVRFDLAPVEGGCALTLTHSGLPRMAGGARAGWHALLEAMPDALEGRATPWALKSAREAALNALYPKL